MILLKDLKNCLNKPVVIFDCVGIEPEALYRGPINNIPDNLSYSEVKNIISVGSSRIIIGILMMEEFKFMTEHIDI